MRFIELPLKGSFVIEPELKKDERGHFARLFCETRFAQAGLVARFVQCSTAYNKQKGLIRGMHFQASPYQETKIVRCTQGAIFDVIVDLRPDSPTYKKGYGLELTASNHRLLYVPRDFAHGYQVLEDHTEIFYMMDEVYHPKSAREISPFSEELELPPWPLALGQTE